MQVILKRCSNLGEAGDIINVKDGYVKKLPTSSSCC